ncbi:ABC transporter substrate-binding protein [Paenibacillus sp. NPDC058071]|uniref:ABC transporter substrate-binding protein n=1 Tax=Paenibacillus sp. NPDC058071 TaxID=3346326 RepID=UPI0036DD958D
MKAILKRCTGIGTALIITVGLLSGCGSAVNSSGGEGKLNIIDFADRSVSFESPPQRIVALGNGEVDIVYALGGSVVGRPEASGAFVPDAAKTALEIGSVHTVDLEKIASVRPDAVLGNYPINMNDVPLLQGIGIKTVLTQANSVDDIKRQIELFGKLLEQEDRAAELVSSIDHAIAEAVKRQHDNEQADGHKPRVLLVYGAPGSYLAALPNSLAGNLLETVGGVNVAAELPRMQNFPQYAQLNTERVVQANPDIILMMTHGNTEEVERGFIREMESSPAWNSLSAVRNGRMHVLPSELFGTNPGTRVVDAVELLEELLRS